MKIKEKLQVAFWVLLCVGAFSQQIISITGYKQRQLDIGYIMGYKEGRDAMQKEYEDQLKAIKHARKLTRAGYEIGE